MARLNPTIKANLASALADELDYSGSEQVQFVKWINTGGKSGSQGSANANTVNNLAQVVLMKPPDWVGRMPGSPAARLKMLRDFIPPMNEDRLRARIARVQEWSER